MRKIKIALIGFNDHSHARQICSSLKEQTDIFELVGYTLPENEREKFPYLMHFLEGYPEMTLEEIGERFGLTRERVRQIKEKAIRKLKNNSRSKLLKSYLG